MQGAEPPITQDLVLIGGGHSHAIALKKFGMNPVAGVKLTLITDVVQTPYSGMLPGYVAGLYRFEECHIDLRPLTQFAQVQMVHDRAIGLDLANHRVLLANRPPIAFDWLSIDIGSTPALLTVPGAKVHTIPVKPISQFLQYWDQLVAQIAQNPQPIKLAIVGGGAGGVELALSIQARLQRIYQAAQQPSSHLELHLFHRGDRLLPERSAGVGHRVQQILTERGAIVHLGQSVTAIESEGSEAAEQKIIYSQSGLRVACDRVFWVTRASAAPWLRQSGLATDAEGFVQVNDRLQSISHPQIFAAGDIATMVNHPRPKAGVFAVRQGKPLVRNLRRSLLRQPLQPFTPQKEFLILLGTGDQRAIASRGFWSWGADSVIWRWKDRIDRQFMQQFTHLKPMRAAGAVRENVQDTESAQPAQMPTMRCAGCGSKIGSAVLSQVLTRIRQEQPPEGDRPDILLGLDAPDDAAVISVPIGKVLVQTIDYFRALVDDPFLFGQICAHHCLSDIFAMGATPQSALAIATLPFAAEAKQAERLYQLLSGATQVLHQAGAPLTGGHTTEGTELALGLTCNGVASSDQLWRKGGMKPGQAIVLTKALGTGTLFAAHMRLQAKGDWIEEAIASMLLSNQSAALCFRQYGATACTDITGFGLLGHLLEMVQASQVALQLNLKAIPMLTGAKTTLQQGIFSSLYRQNLVAARQVADRDRWMAHPLYPLLFDPQTSGGLVATLPPEQVEPCLTALRRSGYGQSQAIGFVVPRTSSPPLILCE
ncbi:MAG: selenide, water dikinase SelD [Oscillatoriophycideae cyanobacterium NC_groundwater_1537_Pr4_S-0.65um_50_18]|nr:selenide, water dikinase SelD [Oscillatoriophycideae cyanobacterium NC_groundwater_1537_Pr4_S-0.65um_50_18]